MGYTPKGRTDESSYDYTDDPQGLALKFARYELEEALEEAEAADETHAYLKFDYEEVVPVEAIREALQMGRRY